MIVKTHSNVVFLHELFDRVYRTNRLGSDSIKSELLGEFKNLARLRLVLGNVDHPIVDSLQMVVGELSRDLVDDLVRRVVIPLHIGFSRTELLAREKLYDLASGLRGLLDG